VSEEWSACVIEAPGMGEDGAGFGNGLPGDIVDRSLPPAGECLSTRVLQNQPDARSTATRMGVVPTSRHPLSAPPLLQVFAHDLKTHVSPSQRVEW
jgi:hypothetical protein